MNEFKVGDRVTIEGLEKGDDATIITIHGGQYTHCDVKWDRFGSERTYDKNELILVKSNFEQNAEFYDDALLNWLDKLC